MTMCGPHPSILPLVLLTLVTLAECQPAQVGDECCYEHWDVHIGRVVRAFTGEDIKRELSRWVGSLDTYFVQEEPGGICKGQLNLRCDSDTKKCECSQRFPYSYVRNPGNYCVGGEDAFCRNYFNFIPCKNKYFKCTHHSGWDYLGNYDHCKLEDDAPKGADEWIEWGEQMFTADGSGFKEVDMKGIMKGNATPTQSPSFCILIFIWALTRLTARLLQL